MYGRLFQNRTMRVRLNLPPGAPAPADPFELDEAGSELVNVSRRISDYVPAILAALRLSAADLSAIRRATDLEDHPAIPATDGHPAIPATFAPLNLANLSVLYRYAVLARALSLSVKDLITLRQLIWMDAFSEIVGLGGRRAFKPSLTIKFVDKVKKVRQSGFSVALLNYLYRHTTDPAGGIAPRQEDIASRLTTIRTGLRQIAADAGAPGPADEILSKELAKVVDSANIDAVLNNTEVYVGSLRSLPLGVSFPQPGHLNISYDNVGHQLRCLGAMTTRQRDALAALAPTPATFPEYRDAVTNLFRQPRALIFRTLDKFLDHTEAEARLIEDASARAESKYAYVLDHLLAYLSRTLVAQTLGEAFALERATAESLVTTLLKSRANTGESLIRDFLALRDGALMASYFDSTDWTGVPVARVDSIVNFREVEDWPDPALVRGPSPVRVKDRFSVRWSGKLLAQFDETYTFYVRTDGRVRLMLDSKVLLDQAAPHDPELKATIRLKAGQLYDIALEYVHTSGTADLQLLWDSISTPKTIIPQSQLFTPSAFNAYTLLHKVALLINTFKMTIGEVAYLSDHGWDFAGIDPALSSVRLPFDLNRLPLEFPDAWGLNGAFFSQWERLCDLFKLRDALPPGEVSLIDVFNAAVAGATSTTLSPGTFAKLEAATGWDTESLKELMGPDGFNLRDVNLNNEIELRRMQACLRLSKRLGVPVKHLFSWAQNPPDADQAQDVKNAVKAKYEDPQWLTVSKGLNDGLREKQRTALIAHILTLPSIIGAGVRDSNQLFEYFLIDVEMSACMATSRIKQAISSVQLFVQRCFLNLEAGVGSGTLSASYWKWMKSYRVWEANRKVFLYPENWIEPELRDDKSPFFKELENEMQQNEVTQDTAETAFLNYLEKLDEVARLDIRGMYWEHESEATAIWENPQWNERQQDPEKTTDVLPGPGQRADIFHVFGRTQSIPPTYHYRKLLNHRTWTPWEKVQVDIEGDHLIPVVYNHRLYLFWPIFSEKQEDLPPSTTAALDIRRIANETRKRSQIQLAWTEYKNGRWSAKKVSPQKIEIAFNVPSENRRNCFFETFEDNGDLVVKCRFQNSLSFDKNIVTFGTFKFSGCEGRTLVNNSIPYSVDASADDFSLSRPA